VVLITGGTGFLGTALARRLLADGIAVRVLARSAAKARPLAGRGAEIVIGDVTDQGSVRAATDGVRAVYHLAGPLLVPGVPAEEYRHSHVRGTQVVLDCAAKEPDLERVVHVSTTGVFGATGDTPVAEDAPWRPANVYERAKADAEAQARRRLSDGLPVVIARPGLVYGPGDVHLASFFQAIQRGLFLPIGRRPAWLHPIYIDDMTDALVRCGTDPRALGEAFNIAGTEPVLISELARVIARAERARLLPGTIPLPAARAAAMIGDLLPARLRARAPLTSSRLEFLTSSRMYDVGKARRLLDFAAPTDLPTGVSRTVDWYQAHDFLPPFPAATSPRAGKGRG
jgi:nucleoside-diphosphate-sugar epimerase